MKSSQDLRRILQSLHRKSYPAYKSLAGSYRFDGYCLNIEHVQGDPFAAPSRLSVVVDHARAGFPAACHDRPWTRTALEDYLIRSFGRQADKFCFQAKGSGKSGMIAVSRCGQEVLKRTACSIREKDLIVRFEVGFPANGRSINAPELEKILFDFLPVCVVRGLYYQNLDHKEVAQTAALAEDQQFIRNYLKEAGLVAFAADGSILPRESGISDRPLRGAVPLEAPETMAVTIDLPNRGAIRGLGIRAGITLIAGGGYHGKSTLLKALERGVYNHIAGDGREYVITDESALKLRAEDGRKITNTDISLFINHLPGGRDTECFSTLDASGSTSQAANIIEGIQAGSRLLLIDEDTSATNLMVRDELMQKVITRNKEPITPFLERVSDLYQQAGISTILVVGSCGSYFFVADKIIQMDSYQVLDITDSTRGLLEGCSAPVTAAPGFAIPTAQRTIDLSGSTQVRKNYRGTGQVRERLKIKRLGKTAFSIGGITLDLRYIEQLVDEEQTQTLAYLLRYAKEHYGSERAAVGQVAEALWRLLQEQGLEGVCEGGKVPSGLAMPRRQEIYACLNRC